MIDVDQQYKRALEAHLGKLAPYPERRFSGRGVVICAGGPMLFTNAYVLAHVLRNALGCRLPIEVWHFGDAETSPRMATLLGELDVATIDATAELTKRPAAIADGWQLKIYALMGSAFEQALLLDADNVPARNPVDVFDAPRFRETGAVLWPDVVDIVAENPIWRACGLEPRTVPAIESGQVLIDKSKCWGALQAVLHLNENAAQYYRFVYGDKDTWLMGFLLTGSPHALIPVRPIADGNWALYQRDFDGGVLFQHRTGCKWRYAGSQDALPGFVGAVACEMALETLRRRWNGLVFNAPSRGAEALQAEAELAERRVFTIVSPGRSPERLELDTHGEIGPGAGADRRNWYCEVEDGVVSLVLCDAFGPRWRLARSAQDRWRGHAVADPSIEAAVAPGPPEESRFALRFVRPWPMRGAYSQHEDAGG